MVYVIYDTNRYGGHGKYPAVIVCHNCTLGQAQDLAQHMSDKAGQEGEYLVEGHEDE